MADPSPPSSRSPLGPNQTLIACESDLELLRNRRASDLSATLPTTGGTLRGVGFKQGAKMAITKDKILSLVVFAAIAVAVVMVLDAAAVPALGLFVALTVSLFGLMLIWFAEPLGEVACFSRGIPRPSPAPLIGLFGWIFLIGYPLLMTIVTRAI
jgi:hypothetical protein